MCVCWGARGGKWSHDWIQKCQFGSYGSHMNLTMVWTFWNLLWPHGAEWEMAFNQGSSSSVPIKGSSSSGVDDQSSRTVLRLVSSLEERGYLFLFTPYTTLWIWFQSWFPRSLCKGKSGIKNKTNKEPNQKHMLRRGTHQAHNGC